MTMSKEEKIARRAFAYFEPKCENPDEIIRNQPAWKSYLKFARLVLADLDKTE